MKEKMLSEASTGERKNSRSLYFHIVMRYYLKHLRVEKEIQRAFNGYE